jgi:hypothetical protein
VPAFGRARGAVQPRIGLRAVPICAGSAGRRPEQGVPPGLAKPRGSSAGSSGPRRPAARRLAPAGRNHAHSDDWTVRNGYYAHGSHPIRHRHCHGNGFSGSRQDLKERQRDIYCLQGAGQIVNGCPRVILMVPAATSLLESRNTSAYRRSRMTALHTKGLTAEPRREAARPGRDAAAYRDPGSAAARGIHAAQVLRPASHARPGRPPSAGARVAGRVRMITLSGSRPGLSHNVT